jgi:hypothetical protein
VFRNGVPEFSDLTFGYSCASEPSIMSIESSDPPDGWGGRYLAIEIQRNDQERNRFKILKAYDEHVYTTISSGKLFGDLPVTQQKVSEYAKEQ